MRISIMSHDARQLPSTMSRNSHAPIVDAIEAGDVHAAVDVVEQHMARVADTYACA